MHGQAGTAPGDDPDGTGQIARHGRQTQETPDRSAPPWLALAMLALLVLAGATGAWAWSHHRNAPEEAPDFTLVSTGYENGVLGEPVLFNLSDHRGEVVLLDFMAVSCVSCRFVTSDIVKPLQEQHAGRDDFTVLSINVWAGNWGETRNETIRLQERENATWRHAMDTDDVMGKYGIYSLPQLAIIDKDGRLVYAKNDFLLPGQVEAAVEAAFAGGQGGAELLQVGLLGLALVAGVATLFTPCSVGLLPAYFGLLLRGSAATPVGRVRSTLVGGSVTALGVVSLYALLAVLLAAFGSALRPHVARLAPVVGAVLLLLGLLILMGFDWGRLTRRFRLDGRRGHFAFGMGYGMASFACTGPIFLPVLLAGFLQGTATGLLVFLVYALAVAVLVFLAAYLVATGQATRLRGLLGHTRVVTKVSAALMAVAGLYLLWFYYRAYGIGLGF